MNNLSDVQRRLLDRWREPHYQKPALRSLRIGGSGLRVLNDFEIEFKYPIVAIAGENGTGKSTVLACAACAYHGYKGFVPNGCDSQIPYYTFKDFFTHSSLDPPHRNPFVTWSYTGMDTIRVYSAEKRVKWSPYRCRPSRPVQFLGIFRALPAIERNVLRSHFGITQKLSGRVYPKAEVARLSRILSRNYSYAARARSTNYSLHVAKMLSTYTAFNMGAGENVTFELIDIMLSLPEGALFVIEELETGLHPRAQKKLIEEMLEISFQRHIQVIFSTHSKVILESLPPSGRVLLKQYGDTITPIYEVSPEFAFSEMADERIPELTIYIEDDVSNLIVSEAIPCRQRCRVRLQQIGSWAALTKQLAAVKRDSQLGNVLAVYDGDSDLNEIKILFGNELGHELTDGEASWLEDHIVFLPGGCSPELWISSFFSNVDFVNQLSSSIKGSPEEIKPILSGPPPADPHDLFYEIGQRLGYDCNDIKRFIITAVVKIDEPTLGGIIEKVVFLLQ